MVKIYGQNIKNLIDLKYTNWVHNNSTNCYAFSLGLDISRYDISNKSAYDGGEIYKNFAKNPIDISELSHQELFELDFKTMCLYFEQIDLKDRIYSPNEWKIAFFDDDYYKMDFHFFREVENGVWYHKFGFENAPTCHDNRGVLITNPIEAYLGTDKYKYQHCYRLSKKKF